MNCKMLKIFEYFTTFKAVMLEHLPEPLMTPSRYQNNIAGTYMQKLFLRHSFFSSFSFQPINIGSNFIFQYLACSAHRQGLA